MNLFWFKAILMSFIPFYRADFPMEAFPKELTYIEYNHGREMGKKILHDEEKSYIALKEFFSKNVTGWQYDLNTYAPGRLFNSTKMRINCLDGALVVNYEDKAKAWIQITKKDVSGSCPSVPLTPLLSDQ